MIPEDLEKEVNRSRVTLTLKEAMIVASLANTARAVMRKETFKEALQYRGENLLKDYEYDFLADRLDALIDAFDSYKKGGGCE